MSNGHSLDRSIIRNEIRVDVTRWPDGYWVVDLVVQNTDGTRIMNHLPLFSGKNAINHSQIQEIKHICALAVEAIIEVDVPID